MELTYIMCGVVAAVAILCCFHCGKSSRKCTILSRILVVVPLVFWNFVMVILISLNHILKKGLLFIVNRKSEDRPLIPIPDSFHHFITKSVIPSFNQQRLTDYQFAVLLLLSEKDLDNLASMTFTPSDLCGQPFLDKDYPSMPREITSYGNYIVARPRSNSCHSEEEIFGKYSSIESPFSNLWSVYVKQNRSLPKCILVYTWNLPCNRCTEVIIRSLDEVPYCWTSVIVAYNTYWRSEIDQEHAKNRDKLINRNITVEQVKYPPFLPPA